MVSISISSNACNGDTVVLIPGRVFHEMAPVIATAVLYRNDSQFFWGKFHFISFVYVRVKLLQKEPILINSFVIKVMLLFSFILIYFFLYSEFECQNIKKTFWIVFSFFILWKPTFQKQDFLVMFLWCSFYCDVLFLHTPEKPVQFQEQIFNW